jgi:glutathione peroxidase-family protein
VQPGAHALVSLNLTKALTSVSQFGGQEPGTDEDISSFCTLNHGTVPYTSTTSKYLMLMAELGVSFPLMKKSDVNGDNTNDVYKWLKNEKSGLFGMTRIKVRLVLPIMLSMYSHERLQWNFEKFLIDKQGNVVNRWASTTTPAAIDAEVAKLV